MRKLIKECRPGHVVFVEHKNSRWYPLDILIRIKSAGIKHAFDIGIPTHCGLVYDIESNDDIKVQEMRANGCVFNIYPRKSEHIIDIAPIKPFTGETILCDNADYLRSIITGYAWGELINDYTPLYNVKPGITMEHVNVGEWSTKMKKIPKNQYCSEHVYLIHKMSGYTNFPDRFEKRVSPFDLYKFVKLESCGLVE
jgi:hypothetical protein